MDLDCHLGFFHFGHWSHLEFILPTWGVNPVTLVLQLRVFVTLSTEYECKNSAQF